MSVIKLKKEFSERAHQIAIVRWARMMHVPIVHIPNEGKRTPVGGSNLRYMGLSSGFPDLFIPEARKGYHGLFLEVKRDRKYSPSEKMTKSWVNQECWIEFLNAQGYLAKFVYGSDDGINAIQEYIMHDRTITGQN